MKHVELDLQGDELGKWVLNKYGSSQIGLTPQSMHFGDDIWLTHLNAPIYRDIGPEAESDLAYVGAAYITVKFKPNLFKDCNSATEVVVRALDTARDAGIPVDYCEHMQVRVGHYREQ